MKSGRTNDEVEGGAGGDVVEQRRSGRHPTADELAALDALGEERARGSSASHELQLTNLDKVLFPARSDDRAVTKRDLIRYYAAIAPAMLPYLADRPVNLHRFPTASTKPGFWHKAAPDARARLAHPLAQRRRRPGRDRRSTSCSTRRRRWRGSANYGAIELHPWTSTVDAPAPADLGDDRHRSRRIDARSTTCWCSPGCTAPRSSTSACAAMPKVTGQRGIQIWVPVAERLHVRRHPGVGRDAVARDRRHGARPGQLGVGSRQARRPGRGSTTPRTRSTRRSSRRSAPGPAPGAPVSVPITWDELDDPDLRPDRWTIDDDRRTARRRRRPARPADRPAAAPAAAVTVSPEPSRRRGRSRRDP